MDIGSICSRELVCVDEAASPVAAAQLMRERHVGCLVVTSHQGAAVEVIGMLTDRDLVVRGLALGADAPANISTLVQRQIVGVREEADLMSAIDVMRDHGVRRLLVVDAREAVVGLVSFDELLGACAHEISALGQALQKGLRQEASALQRPPQQQQPPKPSRPQLRFPAMGTIGWKM